MMFLLKLFLRYFSSNLGVCNGVLTENPAHFLTQSYLNSNVSYGFLKVLKPFIEICTILTFYEIPIKTVEVFVNAQNSEKMSEYIFAMRFKFSSFFPKVIAQILSLLYKKQSIKVSNKKNKYGFTRKKIDDCHSFDSPHKHKHWTLPIFALR